jgi:hypothetical protein
MSGFGPVVACGGSIPGIDPVLSSVTVGYLEVKTLRLSLTNLGCQLVGTALQGTTLLCLREMHDLQSTITQVIASGE